MYMIRKTPRPSATPPPIITADLFGLGKGRSSKTYIVVMHCKIISYINASAAPTNLFII
jgi:hypothetical protein